MTPCWMEAKSLTTESTIVKHAAIEILRWLTVNRSTRFPRGGSHKPSGLTVARQGCHFHPLFAVARSTSGFTAPQRARRLGLRRGSASIGGSAKHNAF